MSAKPAGFVSLDRLKQKPKDVATTLAEIRRIYFRTTRQTIEHDWAAAIELLMSLPTEDDREKATVFMHGLEEMRREWAKGSGSAAAKVKKASSTKTSADAGQRRRSARPPRS